MKWNPMSILRHAAAVPISNHLLAALPRKDYKRLEEHLQPVALEFGQVLHEPGGAIRYVYFPNDGAVSLVSIVSPQKGTEVGTVGSEGVVGISAAIGFDVSLTRAVVQGAGSAMKMLASRFRKECTTNDRLNRELLRFSNAMMGQAAQTAVCNRHHAVEARLARWLLVTRDRLASNEFNRTHQFVALMLGVRRVGVTLAASALEERGLISYSRGNIRILDPKGLEQVSCECYKIVRSIYQGAPRSK